MRDTENSSVRRHGPADRWATTRARARSGDGLSFIACLLTALLLSAGEAAAGNEEASQTHQEKASAAFAQHNYAEAAADFEKAFALTPEPPLLYNAAQAHRLAGNKQRALALYQDYARLYATEEKRAEIDARIAELTQAIERDRPRDTGGAGPNLGLSGSRDAAGTGGAPLGPPPVGITRRPWFWAATGGGVAIVVAVVLVLALGGPKDPSASLGSVAGN